MPLQELGWKEDPGKSQPLSLTSVPEHLEQNITRAGSYSGPPSPQGMPKAWEEWLHKATAGHQPRCAQVCKEAKGTCAVPGASTGHSWGTSKPLSSSGSLRRGWSTTNASGNYDQKLAKNSSPECPVQQPETEEKRWLRSLDRKTLGNAPQFWISSTRSCKLTHQLSSDTQVPQKSLIIPM